MTAALIQVRVKSISFEAERINAFTLQPCEGGALPAFAPGAHIDLHLGSLLRSYSLLNDGIDPRSYVIAVKRDPASRGGSSFLHDMLKAGDIIDISAPRNNFAFIENAAQSVFIAGGIGITPIMSMLRRATALGQNWTLHYACRERCDAAFIEEIATVSGQNGGLNAVFDGEGDAPLDLTAIVAAAAAEAHLYCCGPLPMLAAFEAAAASRPKANVHVEYFSPREDAATDGGFSVRLEKAGITIAVPPGNTILQALLDARIPVSYACSEGTCGTCETRLLAGTPDHRDVYLDDAEHAANDRIMICCSGAKSPLLVLDL